MVTFARKYKMVGEEKMTEGVTFETNPAIWVFSGLGLAVLIVIVLIWNSIDFEANTVKIYAYNVNNESATYCQSTLYMKEATNPPSNYSCPWIEFMIQKQVYPDRVQEIYFCKECSDCDERWQKTETLSTENIIKKFKAYYNVNCKGITQ